MSTHTTRRRPSRVRATGGALAATGAVAAIAQLAVGGGVATADEAVPTNGSLIDNDNATDTSGTPAGQPTGAVSVSDTSEPVVSENNETPTNGSLVDGPPGVASQPTTPAPADTAPADTAPADTAPADSAPTDTATASSQGTPVANTGSDDSEAPEPVFIAPGADDGEAPGGSAPAPEITSTVPAAPVEEAPVVTAAAPAPAAPAPAATQVSNEVGINGAQSVSIDTTYTGGPQFVASDSTVTAPGVPGKVNVTSTYDHGVRSGSVDVAGAPVEASGTATPVDGGQYPDGGGVYHAQGEANLGSVNVSYDGTVNGNNNSTDGNVSVSLPGNGPSVTVPVSTPNVPVDLSNVPSPQQIINGVQGLLGR